MHDASPVANGALVEGEEPPASHPDFLRSQFALREETRDALEDVIESPGVMGDSPGVMGESRQEISDPRKEISDPRKEISDPRKEISALPKEISDLSKARGTTVVTWNDSLRARGWWVRTFSDTRGVEDVAFDVMNDALVLVRAPSKVLSGYGVHDERGARRDERGARRDERGARRDERVEQSGERVGQRCAGVAWNGARVGVSYEEVDETDQGARRSGERLGQSAPGVRRRGS